MTPEQRAIAANVAASHMLDGDRWLDSYIAHTASAIRRRVLATLAKRA